MVMAAFMSFFFSASAIISFVTFMTYVLTGNVLVAQKVFTCVTLFSNIRMVMALKFPIAISMWNDCKVSFKRMEVRLEITGLQNFFSRVGVDVDLFSNIRMVMALKFPIAISMWNDCKVSFKRMEVRLEITGLQNFFPRVGVGVGVDLFSYIRIAMDLKFQLLSLCGTTARCLLKQWR